ncbi:hypothetical protein PsAD2_03919 [Pseudovibrio axinellae]|uniref:FAD assembly factor SdhE n=2 Tax=Pseudovibrio axinellae TaxID=989403 RepID=A0A165UNJ1_9HYPH|nr:hypothetical protein PsAD2_03919 [Pseudovibrio axinellae]SEP64467.1 antitoxin CptB [Pseudovibrio axinellae]
MMDQSAQREDQNKNNAMDNRRKRIIFRCHHRGMKEMDIMLGGYVEKHIAQMDDGELDELEVFLQHHDQDLFSWFIGTKPVPDEANTELFQKILNYYKDKTET